MMGVAGGKNRWGGFLEGEEVWEMTAEIKEDRRRVRGGRGGWRQSGIESKRAEQMKGRDSGPRPGREADQSHGVIPRVNAIGTPRMGVGKKSGERSRLHEICSRD